MEQELSTNERFELISTMINEAKQNFAQGGSFHFLLWGGVIFTCNLGHFILWKFELYDAPFIVWMLTLPTAVVSIVYGMRKSNVAAVKSHLDRLYGFIWLGVFISAVLTLFFTSRVETVNGIILFYAGLGTFLSGITLRFTPSVVGGIALWIAGTITFQMDVVDQYLVAAIGILIGYIIPGIMLRKAEKNRV